MFYPPLEGGHILIVGYAFTSRIDLFLISLSYISPADGLFQKVRSIWYDHGEGPAQTSGILWSLDPKTEPRLQPLQTTGIIIALAGK